MLVFFLAVAGLVAGVSPAPWPVAPPEARAQPPCEAETEPNDTPDGLPWRSGQLCLEGTLPEGDQDLALWEVAPADAATPWTVTLHEGVPGTLSILQLLPVTSPPGSITVPQW